MSHAIACRARGFLYGLLLLAAALTASCGGRARVKLPTGAGTPFPDFASVYAQATTECRAVKTMSASLSLSGRAGSTKLSARIDAGFAEPDRLRLEGYPRVHFGGKPFFVLAASGATATLVLARDHRVLRGAPAAAIVEALAGVALDPGELRSVVSGCALAAGPATAGRSFAKGWVAVDAGEATTFLQQQDGRWHIVAARRGRLTIEYSDFTGARPSTVRVWTMPDTSGAPADLTLRVSQVDVNVPLQDAVFTVDVPPDATPITLEELRGALSGESTAAAGADS